MIPSTDCVSTIGWRPPRAPFTALGRIIVAARMLLAGGPAATARHIAQRVAQQEPILRRGFWNNYAQFSDEELNTRLEELVTAQQRPREQVFGWDTWQETEWRLIHALESQAVLAIIDSRETGIYAN